MPGAVPAAALRRCVCLPEAGWSASQRDATADAGTSASGDVVRCTAGPPGPSSRTVTVVLPAEAGEDRDRTAQREAAARRLAMVVAFFNAAFLMDGGLQK